MKYEQFEMLIESYLGTEPAVMNLDNWHHMKKYHSTLLDKIKDLPEETQKEYFERYYESLV